LDQTKAQSRAKDFNIPTVCSVRALLDDQQVETVLNLTAPQAHAEIGIAVLESGKHLYQEKPLATRLEDARLMLEIATSKGLRLGCAPDTFLGGGLQTCRELIDEGRIGEIVGCSAFMMCHGHEDWHPTPEFFYRAGGGPMFDMGPYYLTALIMLLGPIRSVSAMTKMSSPQRVITEPTRFGQTIDVEVPTHVAGIIDFVNGSIASIVTSFDVWATELPSIEIYGTEGTLSVPDPNTYRGPIRLFSKGGSDWIEVPIKRNFTQQSRGLGLAQMADAMARGCAHRANGEMAYHVLEALHLIHAASFEGRHFQLSSTCSRPTALPPKFPLEY
jgi:predicted dehydrogenase